VSKKHLEDDSKARAEETRLAEDRRREKNWKRWGPYLAERQWSTVREDYSSDGSSWTYFPHDHARSRAYRWGEDGLLGITDRECRLCFALGLWNEQDPILKERLFGLTNSEGNHGEDVKEYYFYIDSTPTHSYMRAMYRYPQREFPYLQLIEENARRGIDDPEYELVDTGVLDDDRYFDITVEYAKASPDDILILVTAANRGSEPAPLHLLPTLWFRNTWSWGRDSEGYWPRPHIRSVDDSTLLAEHATLGRFRLSAEPFNGEPPQFLFTENETNSARLFAAGSNSAFVKDAFHARVIENREEAVKADAGTKAAAYYHMDVPARGEVVIRLRLCGEGTEGRNDPFGAGYDRALADRKREADEFYAGRICADRTAEERSIMRSAYAGLLWSKQFYFYVIKDWVEGDPSHPVTRHPGRNLDWSHIHNRDVISMPDKWEYPWYAAWDLAFHMVAFAAVDAQFAKDQLILFLREWYMHPNGQIPAYEFAFGDVNPPVHAWAAWRVYLMAGDSIDGVVRRDTMFLKRVFQKLTINFTWWVNRKDPAGRHVFSGGFLGLDNIGVFDRSNPPPGGQLEQADGTAWMALYCATMLMIALELARSDQAYEDVASKYFEHYVAIVDSINMLGGEGLWDEDDGFYYDLLRIDGQSVPLRIRSIAGLVPLLAVQNLEKGLIDRLPGFRKRFYWFLKNRPELAQHICYAEGEKHKHYLLSIPSRGRLERMLRYLLDEGEFLSSYGIRSLSRWHEAHPYVFHEGGREHRVEYEPGEARSRLFGGNSNWRGPVWFPLNYMLMGALKRYHHFYGEALRVEYPTGSSRMLDLSEVADEINARLLRIFLQGEEGVRPWQSGDTRFSRDPHWRDLTLFYEYFHPETGRGLGASHQTGWTALVARCFEREF
jgi:hypothetical protein